MRHPGQLYTESAIALTAREGHIPLAFCFLTQSGFRSNMKTHLLCLLSFVFIPPCLAQDFDVTVDRAPDYRNRWPSPTTQTYRVRQVGPYNSGSCYPSALPYGYVPYAVPVNVRSVPYMSPFSNPQAYQVPPGIVLNTPPHVRAARNAQKRAIENAILAEYVRQHGMPTSRSR